LDTGKEGSGNKLCTAAALLTVEKGIQIVVVDPAELEKVFACLWAGVDLEIDDQVPHRCLEENGHDGRELEAVPNPNKLESWFGRYAVLLHSD
jgi:hypothetical protein